MRSALAILLSALAIGTMAVPMDKKRDIVTKLEVQVLTSTVYITALPAEATKSIDERGTSWRWWGYHTGRNRHTRRPHWSKKPPPTAPAPTTEAPTSEPTPEPTTEAPAPTSSEPPAPTPTETQAPEPTTPTSTPTQEPTAEPATPTTTEAPSLTGDGRITGPAQATLSSGPAYEAMILYHHNAARALHDAAPLTWDETLAESARQWAANCEFKHNTVGQNLFATSGTAFNVSGGIIDGWYNNEIIFMEGYWGSESIPDTVFHQVGHFTQMVWKGSSRVGCGSFDCDSSGGLKDEAGNLLQMGKYTVCDYGDAGNVVGAFAANVVPPTTRTVLGWAA